MISDDLQASARPFLDLADALRKDGVHKKITIPQIAVMGDQSSGKSSVLEAISGIQFPRGTGLVTRCATQITMSQGTEWLAELRAADEVRTVGVNEQADLTRHIEELTIKLCGDKGFCADKIIEIKLQAPDAPDLTIIDLPGIVRTHTAGQSEDVKEQVDGLLDRYLKQSRTIILAVIPSNVDIATVDIIERASKVDPSGERTIGVLTKPDLVDRGGESEVRNVLENRTKPLHQGYFMLKNKSQEQLKGKPLTPQEARDAELAYFATSEYAASNRVGVEVLRSALTNLLVSQIQKALPSMLEEVTSVLTKTETELASLGEEPPPSHGRHAAAMASIRDVVGVLRRSTEFADMGRFAFDRPCVWPQELIARKVFAREVLETRPAFDGRLLGRVWSVGDHAEIENDICVTSDIDNGLVVIKKGRVGRVVKVVDTSASSTSKGSRVCLLADSSTMGTVEENTENTCKVKWDSGALSDSMCAEVVRNGALVDFGGDFGRAWVSGKDFTDGNIMRVDPNFRSNLAKRIEKARGRELPGFMNFSVFSTIMGEYLQGWERPTLKFQQTMDDALTDASESVINFHVSKLPGLSEKIKLELKAHLKTCSTDAVKKVHALLQQEKIPCTENHYLWDTINKIRNQRMEDKIMSMQSPAHHPEHLAKSQVIAMLKSDIGNDSNESQEVQEMLDILTAYWKLAMKRYVDHVAMIITEAYTAPKCVEAIERRLTDSILNANDVDLAHMFEQCPRVARRRLELKDTLAKMLKAQARITLFMKDNM